jgi:hypothetical protein
MQFEVPVHMLMNSGESAIFPVRRWAGTYLLPSTTLMDLTLSVGQVANNVGYRIGFRAQPGSRAAV